MKLKLQSAASVCLRDRTLFKMKCTKPLLLPTARVMDKPAANRTNSSCSYDSVLTAAVLPVLYSLAFTVGLTLNAAGAWVFFRIPSKSHFIVYLKNLVVADIVMTLTFPFKVLSDVNAASPALLVFVCRVSSVVFYQMMYTSMLFFGLISVDRCRKILTPFRGDSAAGLTRRKLLSAFIWLVLLSVLGLPNVILTNKTAARPCFSCSELKAPAGLRWHAVVTYISQGIFWGSLATVTVCYTLISKELYKSHAKSHRPEENAAGREGGATPGTQRAPKEMNRKVFLVLAVFFVCFVPFHLARVPYTLSQVWMEESLFRLYQLKEVTLFLSSLSSTLDPFLHFCLCRAFRQKLYQSFCRSATAEVTESSDG